MISSRSRRRISRSSDGVRRGSSRRSSSAGAAAQRDERRPPAGLGRVRGQDQRRSTARASSSSSSAVVRAARGAARPTASATESSRTPSRAARSRRRSARTRPARLDQVDELEVEREGLDDRLGRPEVEAGEVRVETAPLVGVVVLAQRDRPAADALDELEQLRPGLLGDDLAEQRAQQADLGRERVVRPGGPDPGRLGAARRADGVARLARRLTRPNLADRTGSQPFPRPQPFEGRTFPTLVR